ncbi:rhodanese-like domain-containing protein [Alteromonas sp. KUL49]|uniref:rhodanese-like domain-containing protein n=1 Tax=Alteromonas sp. KUL49 TaxID=2480798 RepID=UPI00102F2347|nr:rhodanese-like domain-containing protein [Alteromonas sp. KUL49]TAP37375.1 rhodanese-like domain-containing protein [Alteromonas sp. KUL49]GEA13011.1 rhodanese-like domain-containing protein [Alteromonas sp. KUL49]
MPKTIAERLASIPFDIEKITAQEAHQLIGTDNGLLIDVREPQEVAVAPVPAAINIPRGILEMKIIAMEGDDNRPIYLHCASAVRATLCAEQLRNMGYTNVKVITCEVKQIANAFA